MTNSPFLLQKNSAFDLSNGFLPSSDPVKNLPTALSAWDEFVYSLPKLLTSSHFRQFATELPPFNLQALSSGEDYERAMLVLSYIAHAYVWIANGKPANSLPATIAKPLCAVAKHLGRPPLLSYASYALYNWYRFDCSKPIALDNIALLQNFLGGIDEEWFILIHVDIEQKATKGLQALLPTEDAVHNNDSQTLLKQLTLLKESLQQMQATMQRMPEHCDPYVYYHRVRPYIHGWKDNPALPDGLIYESVEEYQNKPQQFKGETGAQSGIIPLFDAALKVSHKDTPLKIHLDEMRFYMPPEHQVFLNKLEQSPSIRDYIKQQNDKSLTNLYNQCIQIIADFRSLHLKYAAQYIEKQQQISLSNPTAVGTGGTPFMAYLRKHRDETEAFLLPS